MIEVAKAINVFAHGGQVQPSEDQLITLTLGQLQDLIKGAIEEATAPLLAELQDLRARQEALETKIASQEVQQPDQTEILPLKPILEAHRERLRDLGVRMVGLEMAQDELEAKLFAKVLASHTPPRGEKTLARIAKIEEALRERGSCTLGELRKILKIDGATMTRLLARIDKRRFEVFARPGDRREKVLRLKVQIH